MFFTQSHKIYVVENIFFCHHNEHPPRSEKNEKKWFWGDFFKTNIYSIIKKKSCKWNVYILTSHIILWILMAFLPLALKGVQKEKKKREEQNRTVSIGIFQMTFQ